MAASVGHLVVYVGREVCLAPRKRYFLSHNISDLPVRAGPVPSSTSSVPISACVRASPGGTRDRGPAPRRGCRSRCPQATKTRIHAARRLGDHRRLRSVGRGDRAIRPAKEHPLASRRVVVGRHDGQDRWTRRSLPHHADRAGDWLSGMIIGIGLVGPLAATLASFLVEKDLEKEIDPQITEIHERLGRIGATPGESPAERGYTRHPRDRHDRSCWGRLKRRLLIWTWEPRPTCAALAGDRTGPCILSGLGPLPDLNSGRSERRPSLIQRIGHPSSADVSAERDRPSDARPTGHPPR